MRRKINVFRSRCLTDTSSGKTLSNQLGEKCSSRRPTLIQSPAFSVCLHMFQTNCIYYRPLITTVDPQRTYVTKRTMNLSCGAKNNVWNEEFSLMMLSSVVNQSQFNDLRPYKASTYRHNKDTKFLMPLYMQQFMSVFTSGMLGCTLSPLILLQPEQQKISITRRSRAKSLPPTWINMVVSLLKLRCSNILPTSKRSFINLFL